MTVPPTEAAALDPPAERSQITVLVTADAVELETGREEGDALEIRTADSATAAFDAIADVDCLVCDPTFVAGSGPESVEHVRTRRPALPIVVATDDREWSSTLREFVHDDPWADVVTTDGTVADLDRLRYRIPTLVEQRQQSALTERLLAGVELASDAIAIADPDGDLEFVNQPFAAQFGADRDALVGRPWQTIFTADTVDKLEANAIPTVADGWRWRGTCTCKQPTGSTVTARIRLDGLEDGSLIFVVDSQ